MVRWRGVGVGGRLCLVFFQSVLLAGYAYADWTSRRLAPRTQAKIHTALLIVSLALLPIIPDARWKPGDEGGAAPALAILGLLGVTIGLQYFLLSATSPLLQSWYWRHYKHAVPYRLFALSNFASLLALLSYPVAIEPWLRSTVQSGGLVGAVWRVRGSVRGHCLGECARSRCRCRRGGCRCGIR